MMEFTLGEIGIRPLHSSVHLGPATAFGKILPLLSRHGRQHCQVVAIIPILPALPLSAILAVSAPHAWALSGALVASASSRAFLAPRPIS